MRRDLIPATLTLVLVPLTVVTVLRLFPEPPPSALPFPKPTHRVAVAVARALQDEGATVSSPTNSSFVQNYRFIQANGQFPAVGEVQIKEDDPAFWFPFTGTRIVMPAGGIPVANAPTAGTTAAGTPPLSLVTLVSTAFSGTTRDGRAFEVIINNDRFGEGSVVDFNGDADLARRVSDKIAGHLAHPQHKHESPEDRAALMAFFKTKPAANPPTVVPTLDPDVQKAVADGVDLEAEPK